MERPIIFNDTNFSFLYFFIYLFFTFFIVKYSCLHFCPTIIFPFKYILLIMLLQLSQFSPFATLHPVTPTLQQPTPLPRLSSSTWEVHVSSLASPFPILFLTSPCLFCIFPLCFLNPVPFPPLPLPPLS